MKAFSNPFCRLAAAGIALLSAGPSLAAGMSMPCSAFARNPYGDWKVLAPVVLSVEGRLRAPTVGTIFVAGSMTNGLKMADLLDRDCGKAVGHAAGVPQPVNGFPLGAVRSSRPR